MLVIALPVSSPQPQFAFRVIKDNFRKHGNGGSLVEFTALSPSLSPWNPTFLSLSLMTADSVDYIVTRLDLYHTAL